jgi:hypothetical protein
MKIYPFVIVFAAMLTSCGEKRTCSFDTLENAVNCACEISNEQMEAKEDDDIIDQLKLQTKELNDQFEQALKDSVFTEQEFIQKLKADCESYNQ